MKRFFTCLFFFLPLFITAQFNDFADRFLFKEQTIRLQPGQVGCGICKGMQIDNTFRIPPVPVVRRTDTLETISPVYSGRYLLRMSCAEPVKQEDPLLVVDGTIIRIEAFKAPDPNDIEEITVLNKPQSMAIFGSAGQAGAIIMVTKKTLERKFRILDSTDKIAIPRATVSILTKGKMESWYFSADDSGHFSSPPFRQGQAYDLVVTAVGYKPLRKTILITGQDPKTVDLYLARDIPSGPEAMITCYDCIRTIRCGSRMTVTRRNPMPAMEKKPVADVFYPNPVKAGDPILLKKDMNTDELLQTRLFQADGRLAQVQFLRTNKGPNLLHINTGSNLVPGTYFLQVLYANGRVAASGKIILQ